MIENDELKQLFEAMKQGLGEQAQRMRHDLFTVAELSCYRAMPNVDASGNMEESASVLEQEM